MKSVQQTKEAMLVAARKRRRQMGRGLVETVTALGVMTLATGGMVSTMVYSYRQTGSAQAVSYLTTTGRRSVDQILLDLRGGRQILTSQAVQGTTFTTGTTTVVFVGPGVTSTSGGDVLTSIDDYFAISYDSDNKKITETISPGTGSNRPSRNKLTLAKDVSAVTFKYKVRDQFAASAAGTTSYTLNATPSATPTVYVNGVSRSITYSSGTKTFSVSNTVIGDDIQAVYTVSPTNTAALTYVSEVDITVSGSTKAYGTTNSTSQIAGTARLRNYRN